MIERVLPPRNPNVLDRITIHFDGVVFQSPPHPSAWSFVVHFNGEKIHEQAGPLPDLPEYSGNDVISKFFGLHEALHWLNFQDRFDDNIVFMGDNLMMMGSMAGNRQPPDNEKYRPLWKECRKLASPFYKIQFVWITKQENRDARVASLLQIEKMRTPA